MDAASLTALLEEDAGGEAPQTIRKGPPPAIQLPPAELGLRSASRGGPMSVSPGIPSPLTPGGEESPDGTSFGFGSVLNYTIVR